MGDRLYWDDNGRMACDDPAIHRFIVGDAMKTIEAMPDNSVDVFLYSPPYWSLRTYLAAEDPNKEFEMGGEPTPGEYVDGQVQVVEAIRKKLTPWGSAWIVVGDTRLGSGGAGGDYNKGGLREGQSRYDGTARKAASLRDERYRYNPGYQGPVRPERMHVRGQMPFGGLDKSLGMIPEALRLTLGYGRNPHTGRETEMWRVRQVYRWCVTNPPVGRLDDRFRDAIHETIFIAPSRVYWFDLDAVRRPPKNGRNPRDPIGSQQTFKGHSREREGQTKPNRVANDRGAPPYDWVPLATYPYKGQHYAAFPPKLVEPILTAACPPVVCKVCGLPAYPGTSRLPTCRHRKWRRGVVVDPFAGTGTTQLVASHLGLSSIGIDLDIRNAELARARVGEHLAIEGI